jgi:hypothetical protein
MKFVNRFFVLLPLCFVAGFANNQSESGAVSGKVVFENGDGAASATVMLEDTKLGVSTEVDGSFVLSNVPTGSYKVLVRLIGYEQESPITIRVRSNDTVRVVLKLRENEIELSQILVTGTRRQAAEDTRPSVTTMTPREAKYLPGAAEDVLRGLQALPGVTSVSDYSSQLVIRGAGPDQNLIMIDGFEVINPYRLYGFVSMFNPETVSDISLQTGGFAAQYGDRLSAVIDVKNREGRADVPFAAKLNFSLTNMNLIFEGSMPIEGSSYLLSLRRTYYDLILGPILKKAKLVEGDVALPNFRDLQFRGSVPISEDHKLIVNVLASRDGVSLVSGAERDRADSVNVVDDATNTMAGALWQYNPSKEVIINTQVSWYRNKGAGLFDGTFVDPSQNSGTIKRGDTTVSFVKFGVDYGYIYEKTSFVQRVLWSAGSHTLEAGCGADFLRTDFTRTFDIDPAIKELISQRGFVVPTSETQIVHFNRYNLYAQDRLAIGDKLFVQPGIRFDYYPFLKTKIYPSPRVNVSYKVSDLTTIRVAYGMYTQSPGMEKQNAFQSRLTFSKDRFTTLDAERSQHYILGFDRMLNVFWQLKVEGYYKNFDGVIVPEKLQGSQWYSAPTGDSVLSPRGWRTPVRIASDSLTSFPVNDATGRSYGFEVMLQKIRSQPTEKFTGWISYALSYADRDRDGIRTAFLFDQRHAVNVVGNYKFSESWEAGLRFTLRSGRPYPLPLGVRPRIIVGSQGGIEVPVIQRNNQGNVLLDVEYERDAFSGRLDLYHSLDLRVTTYPGWWGLNWSVYLDVTNVLNNQNVQQLNYYVNDRGQLASRTIDGIPILPSLGMSVSF